MLSCQVCGNEYDKPLQITQEGQSYTFDCFECAIHKLAPECKNCHCRIVGHGVETDGKMYCCAHCAKVQGEPRFQDRI